MYRASCLTVFTQASCTKSVADCPIQFQMQALWPAAPPLYQLELVFVGASTLCYAPCALDLMQVLAVPAKVTTSSGTYKAVNLAKIVLKNVLF